MDFEQNMSFPGVLGTGKTAPSSRDLRDSRGLCTA
jgi:hypothetical protein